MKRLCLGTATWGWTVDRDVAFEILDHFFDSGGRYVDTANNYPINSEPGAYRRAATILADWISSRNAHNLRIFHKIGSVTNRHTPEIDLSPENLREQIAWASDRFGPNLFCGMIHWDNRNEPREIAVSCQVIDDLKAMGCRFGVSGIRHPEVYAAVLDKIGIEELHVQTKHNFVQSGLSHYLSLSEASPLFWGYGLAAGGFKMTADEIGEQSYSFVTGRTEHHEAIRQSSVFEIINQLIVENDSFRNSYHVGMAFAESTAALTGYIVAPSSPAQLADILDFRTKIEESANLLHEVSELMS